jgi:aminodeoxyfutalosine synthase
MISPYEFEGRVKAGEPLTRPEMERLLVSPNLVEVGALAELGRKARCGDIVTYGRVCEVGSDRGQTGVKPGSDQGQTPLGDPGEIRLIGAPSSADEARERVSAAAAISNGVPLTAFSLGDLLSLVGGDHLALSSLAAELHDAGLDAVAEVPLDGIGDTENAIEVVRAVHHGGLGAWRATVGRAPALAARMDLIERAADIQRETGCFRAFAPLPRTDSASAPGTGFDDVRTVAAARLMAAAIPAIQVDWPLYGPKLAQVAIAYGASDLDGISAVDTTQLGPRRSPVEDIERQIRAAFATPARRNGRYERVA